MVCVCYVLLCFALFCGMCLRSVVCYDFVVCASGMCLWNVFSGMFLVACFGMRLLCLWYVLDMLL